MILSSQSSVRLVYKQPPFISPSIRKNFPLENIHKVESVALSEKVTFSGSKVSSDPHLGPAHPTYELETNVSKSPSDQPSIPPISLFRSHESVMAPQSTHNQLKSVKLRTTRNISKHLWFLTSFLNKRDHLNMSEK